MKYLISASLLALSYGTPALARPMTPADLVSLSRVSDPAVSPDGRWLVWQQRETDLAANRGRTDIWRLDLAQKGAIPQKLIAESAANETAPAFSADGKFVYYMTDLGGDDSAVWRIAIGGGAASAVTSGAKGLSGFKLSPDNSHLLVWADRKPGAVTLAQTTATKDAGAGSARTYDQLFVRHWDSWANGERSQLFVMPIVDGKASGEGVAIARNLVGDTPSKPIGGSEELSWSADSKAIFFALREAGRIEATSTNLDIFMAPADGSAPPTNLTITNKGTDNLPAASPDGKWLAYGAMARAGYEADRMVIQLRNLKTGATTALTAKWDFSAGSIAWSVDSKSLLVTAEDNFDNALFRIELATGKATRLSGDGSVATALPIAQGGAIVALSSLIKPANLYRIDAKGTTQLTVVNADKLAGVDFAEPVKFSFAGANGDIVWAYALKPAGLADGAKAPVAMLVHGGPQGTFGNSWSYRWNPSVFTGAGFAPVMVDFHGSTGHGQAFTDSINKDWGGKPLADLRAGLAATKAKFAWADTVNACAAGGSYGGYMMNWIAGNWPDGFKCLVNHAGVFDARAMAYETEELWFDEWEHGGPYFAFPQEYEKWNPVTRVDKWQAPMLVLHGEKDFRIPYSQGLGAFTALQRLNIPSRLVMFPDENHWILKPKNSLQWYSEVLSWMQKWTRSTR